MPRDLILVVGLAGAGKTTVAKKLGEFGHEVVHSDTLRYSDQQWTRRPVFDYHARVQEAIAAARGRLQPGKCVVFESSYRDANDPDNARALVLRELVTQAKQVFIIRTEGLVNDTARLIDRCIGRAAGTEPQGACPETSENRARLLIKFIQNHDENKKALSDFDAFHSSKCVVSYVSLSDFTNPASLAYYTQIL